MSITAFTSSIATTVRWSIADTHDLGTANDSQSLLHSATKTFGTGAAQANLVWHDRMTADATLDPAALPRSVFGVSGNYSFTTIKTFRVKNAAASGNVTVTAAALGLSAPVTLHPGAILLLDSPTGWAASGSVAISGVTNVEIVLVGVGTGEA